MSSEIVNIRSLSTHSIIAAMQSLPVNIYSVADVREIDRVAIEDLGTPGYTLMERAAAASVAAAEARFPKARRWQILCGAGNNGGDGYVVARLAAAKGVEVDVLTMVDPDRLQGDAATARQDLIASGANIAPWSGDLDPDADLLVDAILGSGLERVVRGEFAAAVAALNAHPAPVHALDIPTGLHGDTGQVLGTAVVAELTTTFVGLKSGLFLGAGPDHCGELTFSDLDTGDDSRESVSPVLRRIDSNAIADAMPRRQRTAHKGHFGHVLVVGGGPGMPGAARLAAEAALRTGAGRVSLATHPDHASVIAASRPEIMAHAIDGPGTLESLLERADVLTLGPCLGRSDWALELKSVAERSDIPSVWDADGLNLLADRPDSCERRIITPHPGEAATLLATDSMSIQGDRLAAVKALAAKYGGVAVLKGAGTLIADAETVPSICTSGNPGMAAAGMGDVLTGVIAGLLAQGADLSLAARAGVEVHARAGDLAAADGERGMLASDLLDRIREVVNP